MQMTESVFVVFIILIIIVMGFVIYSKFQETSIKENERMIRNIEIIKMAQKMSSWPELECSLHGTQRFVCLDAAKLTTLGDFIQTSRQTDSYGFNYYYDALKKARITIKELYPPLSNADNLNQWVLYNNPGRTPVSDLVLIPVNIYHPVSKTFSMGIIELQIYD